MHMVPVLCHLWQATWAHGRWSNLNLRHVGSTSLGMRIGGNFCPTHGSGFSRCHTLLGPLLLG